MIEEWCIIRWISIAVILIVFWGTLAYVLDLFKKIEEKQDD